MRLHHIGYLVRDIDRSVRAFAALGYGPVFLCAPPPSGASVYDESRQSDICFLSAAGGVIPLIELIAPRSESSPIWGLLRTYKNTPYHLCFESEALDRDVETLRQAGWTVFQSPAPVCAVTMPTRFA